MEETHNCRNDRKTISDIEEFGLSVIMIEATDYLPSFAYSIGLWQKYKHPEIICFGLSVQTLHALINDVADLVKDNQIIETGIPYPDFFNEAKAEFVKVDPRSIRDYFGYAIDFYDSVNFPAVQLVWTDRNDKFPWEIDFEQEFIYRQPLLDRNAEFKFRESTNLGVFTTRQWLEERKSILHVVHDEDGDWQFLTGDQQPEDIRLVALEQLILRDCTLNDIFNLDYGEEATRNEIGERWERSNRVPD